MDTLVASSIMNKGNLFFFLRFLLLSTLFFCLQLLLIGQPNLLGVRDRNKEVRRDILLRVCKFFNFLDSCSLKLPCLNSFSIFFSLFLLASFFYDLLLYSVSFCEPSKLLKDLPLSYLLLLVLKPPLLMYTELVFLKLRLSKNELSAFNKRLLLRTRWATAISSKLSLLLVELGIAFYWFDWRFKDRRESRKRLTTLLLRRTKNL